MKTFLSPWFHFKKTHAHEVAAPGHKLFVRYSAVVTMLFLVGSITPTINASYDSYNADLGDAWDSQVVSSPFVSDQDGYITKMNPQTSIGDRSIMNDYLTHTVTAGETISTIAASYKLHANTVLWANNIVNPNTLRTGQKLFIPPVDGISHRIGKDENLQKIAKTYSVSTDSIIKQNGLAKDGALIANEDIFIPGATPLPVEKIIPKPLRVLRDTPARIASSTRINAVVDGSILKAAEDVPLGAKPFIKPTHGAITQRFHAGHYADDIANPDRPPIWAAAEGTVVEVTSGCADVSYSCGHGYGNHVIVDHGNGLTTLYGHMTYPAVKVGDTVKQGDVLGKMGRSGRVHGRTGIHLHFEVRKNGVKENPEKYF